MNLSVLPDWEPELDRWLPPFLAGLARQSQRHWAATYIKGLLLQGGRKSIERLAARVAPGEMQQLHHFITSSPWPTLPVESRLVLEANRLAGDDALLALDECFVAKQGEHSVGVARQYCPHLGRRTNCQILVTLTLVGRRATIPVGVRLFLPEAWCASAEYRRCAAVPTEVDYRPSWRLALDEVERLAGLGLRFDRLVVAPWLATCAEFRAGPADWEEPATASYTDAQANLAAAQAQRLMQDELGLAHFEGRSWRGLHRHALMVMLAAAFREHLRLEGTPAPEIRFRPSLAAPRVDASSWQTVRSRSGSQGDQPMTAAPTAA